MYARSVFTNGFFVICIEANVCNSGQQDLNLAHPTQASPFLMPVELILARRHLLVFENSSQPGCGVCSEVSNTGSIPFYGPSNAMKI